VVVVVVDLRRRAVEDSRNDRGAAARRDVLGTASTSAAMWPGAAGAVGGHPQQLSPSRVAVSLMAGSLSALPPEAGAALFARYHATRCKKEASRHREALSFGWDSVACRAKMLVRGLAACPAAVTIHLRSPSPS